MSEWVKFQTRINVLWKVLCVLGIVIAAWSAFILTLAEETILAMNSVVAGYICWRGMAWTREEPKG